LTIKISDFLKVKKSKGKKKKYREGTKKKQRRKSQNKNYREKTLQKAKTARRNRSFGEPNEKAKPSEFWNKIQRFRPLVYAVFPLGAPLINRH